MSTYTQILYHIVFSTKNRERTLSVVNRDDLMKYICGIIKNKKSHLYRINCVSDHIHILTSIHPTVCLADFIKTIKTASSIWIKENKLFLNFTNWQSGYGAFTVSNKDKKNVIEYIKNQEQHHQHVTFIEEYKNLLEQAGVEYDEKYLL
ncbi:MAG: IS200/IS605 family transposase [Candidatus Cloacimonetes bacterium]|nr:IS200/IS605 family transposase [Candidatus Cloacimonadota bacterium]